VSLTADLDTLKAYVGARSAQDDQLLADRLEAATHAVYYVVYTDDQAMASVQEAILLTASKLYKRRQSPEGVAGFGLEGAAVRIVATDPDVGALLERHIDYSPGHAGIA